MSSAFIQGERLMSFFFFLLLLGECDLLCFADIAVSTSTREHVFGPLVDDFKMGEDGKEEEDKDD